MVTIDVVFVVVVVVVVFVIVLVLAVIVVSFVVEHQEWQQTATVTKHQELQQTKATNCSQTATAKSNDDHELGVFREQQSIQQLATQQVALLKESAWEGNEANALAHRSPLLAPGPARLLLTVDIVQFT